MCEASEKEFNGSDKYPGSRTAGRKFEPFVYGMEIKKGDKVKVSEDAPRMYVLGFDHIYKVYESTVLEVEDGNAVIKSSVHVRPKAKLVIPTKYLIKVGEEEKEAKIKVGDKVRNIIAGQCGKVLDIRKRIAEVGVPYDSEKHYWDISNIELVEPTEQTEAEKKPYDGISEETANEISNMLEAYAKALSGIADSFDWQRYAADLAKEIVLKTVNSASDQRPMSIAEYAVSVAKAVVEGLKRK